MYVQNENLSYSEALEAMENGKVVSRKRWAQGLFAFKQDPSEAIPDCVIKYMKEKKIELVDKNPIVSVDAGGQVRP